MGYRTVGTTAPRGVKKMGLTPWGVYILASALFRLIVRYRLKLAYRAKQFDQCGNMDPACPSTHFLIPTMTTLS